MKKRVNRWIVMAAAVCSMLLFPVMTGYAADGTLMLSDPTGNVGGEIPLTVRIDAGGQPIGDGTVTLTYDAAMLELISGTNAEGGEGTVKLSGSGTGTETELVFDLVFRGLAEGSTAIQVAESTAYLFSDETLNLTAGESMVTIGAGDGTAPAGEPTERITGQESIEIGGQYYAIYENFTDALIPAGFSRTTAQYAGTEHSAIMQDSSGKVIFFMVSGDSDPIMALYNESDSTFIRAERVDVSESFYIFVLSSGDGSSLPEEFYETTLSLHEVNFPAWQNMDSMDFYLVYGLSSGGTEGFYQYDAVDSTYQRYVAVQSAPSEEPEEKEDNTILGKIEKIIGDHLIIIGGAAAAVVLILFIIIIVLCVKLGRRNAELDDLYAGDDDHDMPNVRKSSRKQFVGYDDEDEGDDFMDDGYGDEDGYEDDYGDEYYDDEDEEYDDYDDEYDDEEDMKEYAPGKKSSKKSDSYDDIDFIDV